MAGEYNTTGYRNGDGILIISEQTAVTQGTSVSTAVTCDAYSGVITTFAQSAAAAGEAQFTVNNAKVKATDVVGVCIKTHTSAGTFIPAVTAVADGSFQITLTNLHAATAGNGVLILNFAVQPVRP